MRRLPSYNFRRQGRGNSNSRYDWHKILDGNIWSLKKGADFNIDPRNVRTLIYCTAKKHGLKARVNIDGDTLIVQAYDEQPSKGETRRA